MKRYIYLGDSIATEAPEAKDLFENKISQLVDVNIHKNQKPNVTVMLSCFSLQILKIRLHEEAIGIVQLRIVVDIQRRNFVIIVNVYEDPNRDLLFINE